MLVTSGVWFASSVTTDTANDCVAAPPRPSTTRTVTGCVPRSAANGVQLASPGILQAIDADKKISDETQTALKAACEEFKESWS